MKVKLPPSPKLVVSLAHPLSSGRAEPGSMHNKADTGGRCEATKTYGASDYVSRTALPVLEISHAGVRSSPENSDYEGRDAESTHSHSNLEQSCSDPVSVTEGVSNLRSCVQKHDSKRQTDAFVGRPLAAPPRLPSRHEIPRILLVEAIKTKPTTEPTAAGNDDISRTDMRRRAGYHSPSVCVEGAKWKLRPRRCFAFRDDTDAMMPSFGCTADVRFAPAGSCAGSARRSD